MVPLPSISATSCLSKSVLIHMILFMKILRASISSNTWLHMFLITFFVHYGRSFSSNLFSLHAVAMASKASSVIYLRTSTLPSALSRDNFWRSPSRPSVSRAPAVTTKASFLLFKSFFRTIVEIFGEDAVPPPTVTPSAVLQFAASLREPITGQVTLTWLS